MHNSPKLVMKTNNIATIDGKHSVLDYHDALTHSEH